MVVSIFMLNPHVTRMVVSTTMLNHQTSVSVVQLVLSLWMVSPLLEKLNCFVKLCQSRQVFLADLADATTALIEDLDNMYVNEETAFTGEGFEAYTELLAADDDSMLVWEEQDDGEGPEPEVLKIKATDGDDFDLSARPATTGQRGRPSRQALPVTRAALEIVKQRLQKQATEVAKEAIDELKKRFPSVAKLQCLSIVYPQWFRKRMEYSERELGADFCTQLDGVKEHYGKHRTNKEGLRVAPLVDVEQLRSQASAFRRRAKEVARMLYQRMEAEEQVEDTSSSVVGLASRFWRELCLDAKFKVDCSEYLVLAELAFVMVPGSVEDERLFSAMNFIKNELRNRLKNPHLTAAVRLFFSRQFTVKTFPYMEALKAWRAAAAKRGRYTGTGHK